MVTQYEIPVFRHLIEMCIRDSLKARTQQQCDAETEAAARKRAQTEADCKAMLARTQQELSLIHIFCPASAACRA